MTDSNILVNTDSGQADFDDSREKETSRRSNANLNMIDWINKFCKNIKLARILESEYIKRKSGLQGVWGVPGRK